ncbi:NAD(P)H-dependent flavin oxidoreductase YrpB, nitropropane dioxygenase family [Nakamurella panacisegetis]|uniref:Propionate 3-nitronate monooxygenase n=1 Tax=Nakamurella panacisegetis TaxID=1090615 RepID=A0A1H0L0Z5_9ACTN|nr:nitronate monooxygenase [Nakamurella panacisegetis]SDO61651.1 NAD(P)H-dependent flavin oxidoreductase YrpB, nitropropane dioxygenase family [Nakamurella panacisegetis]
MSSPFDALGVTNPVVAAPMAGGPSTPALVIAAARAGSLGFLAAGYKSPAAVAEEIATVRGRNSIFGVNLFAPNSMPVDRAAYRSYAAALAADLAAFGLEPVPEPREDDDSWAAKIDLLLADPVPVVGFTFGLPDRAVLRALRRAGTTTVQTVTNVEEALLAEEAGIDVLAVQASAAGGHSGTLTPSRRPADVTLPSLVTDIAAATTVPIVAAGGVSDPVGVTAGLGAGATAVMVGTVLLRSDESGTSDLHRAALVDPARTHTVVTHAFTGRPARALTNAFIDRYDAVAPLGYPALHHLTSPLRKAATAVGQPELVHLWAGTGFRAATAEPAETILRRLASAV